MSISEMAPAAGSGASTPRPITAPEVDDLYRREILLLQGRDFEGWLALFDPELEYRVPSTTIVDRGDGPATVPGELGHYDDTLDTLRVRTQKILNKQSWSEYPPSRIRYFVQLLDLRPGADGTTTAVSNLLVMQARESVEQTFSGERLDDLLWTEGALRIRRRTVHLDRPYLGRQALSVFF